MATDPDGDPVERYSDDPPLPGTEGDVEALPMYAGQSAGLVGEVRSAEEIVTDIVETAVERIESVAALSVD